jgi:hypothetical protein
MRLTRILVRAVALLLVLSLTLYFGVRFHDGPIGIIPGGPLVAGDFVETPTTDWTFATDLSEIELQLESQGISRTTWILVRDGAAYIPCSLGFPPGKNWYEKAQQDGRAILRIDGRRHRVTLTRDDDPALAGFARPEVERKYGALPPTDAGVLFFRVTSRS